LQTALAEAIMIRRERSDKLWTATASSSYVTKLGVRGTQSRLGVAGIDMVEGVAAVGIVEGLAVRAAVIEVASATQVSNNCQPDQPLVVTKYADPKTPNVGDVVTFVLRYENFGAKTIRDIVIADSLSARFEYIPGSAQCDRPTVFTIGVNESYSALLRWEVKGELAPGQSGLIRFQARVR
jgi:uncharacterized repeat protein (TIGR01451 family)